MSKRKNGRCLGSNTWNFTMELFAEEPKIFPTFALNVHEEIESCLHKRWLDYSHVLLCRANFTRLLQLEIIDGNETICTVIRNGYPEYYEVRNDSSNCFLIEKSISQLHHLLLFTVQKRKQYCPDAEACAHLPCKLRACSSRLLYISL